VRQVNEDEELEVICLVSIDPFLRAFNVAVHFDSTTKPTIFLDHLQALIDHYKHNPEQIIDDASVIETQ